MLATFVNTSDGFEDCWLPFFSLFTRFGAGLRNTPIYLNTERISFAWPNLDLNITAVWPQDEELRPSWSECLRRGVEKVREPYLIYFQEDYFLKRQIDSIVVERCLLALKMDPAVGVVYLNQHGPSYTQSTSYNPFLIEIGRPCPYLASTQTAIWRKDILLSLLRKWENAWMFEVFGSHRAARSDYKVLALRPEFTQRTPTVDYVYTGIMKGQWNSECLSLFMKYGIETDFSRRGFYQDRGRLRSRYEVARKLTANPFGLLRSLETLFTS